MTGNGWSETAARPSWDASMLASSRASSTAREIEEVNGPLKFGKHAVRQCQGDGSFAYPTCPDD